LQHRKKGTYIQEQNIQINKGKMPMTQECQSTAAYNEALVRPRQGVQAAPTCNEALIRPLQGCQATPTYKEALIRPPPVKILEQLETDSCLCERCDHIMAKVFAMATNKTDQAAV
jgi:hypothetical protein